MRLIDADALEVVSLVGVSSGFAEGVQYILEKIDRAPTIEATRLIHGHWEIGGVHPHNGVVGNWKCSVCHRTSLDDSEYCPHCGVVMNESIEED